MFPHPNSFAEVCKNQKLAPMCCAFVLAIRPPLFKIFFNIFFTLCKYFSNWFLFAYKDWNRGQMRYATIGLIRSTAKCCIATKVYSAYNARSWLLCSSVTKSLETKILCVLETSHYLFLTSCFHSPFLH